MSAETPRRVAWSLEELPPEPSAVTIGFFDGVHRGHQLLVDRASRHAASRSLRTVAATFDRHPTQVTRPGSEPRLLMTLERRVRTLHEVGADLVLVIPFTVELSELSPAGFVDEVLCDALNAHVVVVGENFRFGHLAVGDVGTLSSIGLDRGLEVDVVELLTLDGEALSSTHIRRRLATGDVEWAAVALGRPHVIDGVVVQGEGRGRSIGIPTANVSVSPHMQLPANGVYAGHVEIAPHYAGGARRVPAVTNVGVRPTFGGETFTVETHLLDFESDLYGVRLGVELAHRLREERRFANPEGLVAQIRADIDEGRELLGLPRRPLP